MIHFTITDNNSDRYTYTASANILGRRYDNIAEYITVAKPESESGRDCIMIVTYGDTVIDHIPVGDTPIAITSNLSQYASVKIGFAFLGADGYIKNSEVKQFYFLIAQKPDGFVPLPPVQKTTIDYLISHGFTGAKLENNILSFTNAAGGAVAEIKLSGFIQEQADWKETDPTAETYIKNKPTKLSEFTDDLGAYVKPESGIPESDLSAEVQNKLNAGSGSVSENLLREPATVVLGVGLSDGKLQYTGYTLGLVVDKEYTVELTHNNTPVTVTGKVFDLGFGKVLMDKSGSSEMPVGMPISDTDNLSLLVADNSNLEEVADNCVLYLTTGATTTIEHNVVINSITEVEEVVADKVKNPLKITVNGEAKEYDGSKAVDVNINTTTGKNILKSDVTFTEVGGGIGYSILDYALNLEVGKAYKLKWDISGEQYSQTTYCWLKNEQIQLGMADSGGGGESILLIPNDPESGRMWVIDKYYANPATEETAPSENNAGIVVTGYASTLKLISIEDAGVYIPVPTTADVGKILKVSAHGHYELVEP